MMSAQFDFIYLKVNELFLADYNILSYNYFIILDTFTIVLKVLIIQFVHKVQFY